MNTTKMALRLLAVCSALLLSACPLADLPEPPRPECTHASDCAEGKLCGPAGVCVDECRTDRDCPRGEACDTGVCKAPPGSCTRDTDCQSGEVCAVNGKCVKPCETTAECGPGFTCLGGACLSSTGGCGRDVECGPGEVCAANGACVAPCSSDSGCAAGERCSAGACVEAQKACAGASECAGAEVCSPAGLCQVACTGSSQCPNGQACEFGFCAWLPAQCGSSDECPASELCGAAQLCVDKCLSARDCAVGLVCADGACAPPAPSCVTSAECGAGQSCSPAGSCVSSCSGPSECAGAEECSLGACVPQGPAWAKLAGAVELSGVTDKSGVSVRIRGADAAVSLSTTADGTYGAAGLPPGRYTVTLEASNVREGKVALDVAAVGGTTSTVPTQTLTPVGTVQGTVTLQGASNHQGTQVAVLAANAGAVTDAAGGFTVRSVPVGTYELAASAAGYAAGTASGVVVGWGQTTVVPPFSLSPLPVSNNTTFAFLSVPPSTAVASQPYVYTATAGGGGVTNPTYAVVSGPSGFSIDGATGAVSWTPSAAQADDIHIVTLSARGGGMTVFQIFSVDVSPTSPPLYDLSVRRISQAPDASWVWNGSGLISVLGADGGTTDYSLGIKAVSFVPDASELLNGGAITGFDAGSVSGTFTGVRGSFGTIGATWAGGTVTSVTPADTLQLASTPALREVGSAALVDGLTIGSVTPESYPVTAVSGLSAVTGVSMATGTVSALTSTELTDGAAAWTPGALVGRCVKDSSGENRQSITANTATTLTTAGDLTQAFAAGGRYFVGACANDTAPVTITDAAASFGAIANGRADLYLGVQPLGSCVIASSPAPTTTTFTCDLSVRRYADVMQLPVSGRYAVGTSSGVLLTVTSTGASFATGLATTNRVHFDPSSDVMVIDSNTADTITFRAPLGQATAFVVGRSFRLTTTTHPYLSEFTLGFSSGTLTGSRAGEQLFIDSKGASFQIVSNTATAATIQVPYTSSPLANVVGSLAAVDPVAPRMVLVDALGGLPPLLGQRLVRGGSWARYGDILASTPAQVTVRLSTSAGAMYNALASFTPGAFWTWAPSTSGVVMLEVPLGGTPGLTPDGLLGRVVALQKDPSRYGTVRSNGADSLEIEVGTASVGSFLAASAGDRLLLGDGNGDHVVTLTDSSATWTADQWAGWWVVAGSSAAAYVRGNTATTLDLVLADASHLDSLAPGASFALAPANSTQCSGPAGYVHATVTLAGATLTPSTYASLFRSSTAGFPVLSNTAASLLVGVCASEFASFLSGVGQVGVTMPATGRATVWLDDSAASLTPGAFAGRQLALIDRAKATVGMRTNTATSFEYALTPSEFYGLSPQELAGQRYGVTEADGQLLFTLRGSFSAPAGSLVDRFVVLLSDGYYSLEGYPVESNSASTITVRVPPDELDSLFSTGQLRHGWLTWGSGLVVRYTVANAAWQPGALVGLLLDSGTISLRIVANTSTTVTAVSSTLTTSLADHALSPSSMSIESASANGALALDDGGALVPLTQSGGGGTSFLRLSPGGAVTRFGRTDAANGLVLSPLPPVKGIITSFSSSSGVRKATVAGASWTPGAFRGALARSRAPGSASWDAAVVVDNTSDTLTVLQNLGYGRELLLEPYRFSVSGTTLTPGALTGRDLLVDGRPYAVRGNTATEVSLYPSLQSYEFPGAVSLSGTAAILLDRGTGGTVYDMQSDGAGGAWIGTGDGLWRFDGNDFTQLDVVATAQQLGSGTISSVTNSSITDLGASFTRDALIGAKVRLGRGIYVVSGNTEQTIFFTSNFSDGSTYSPPIPGEAYVIADGDGVSVARAVSLAGGALWVGASNGLHRRQGTSWTRYTVASTESSLGLADGLLSNTVGGVLALSATEAYAWSTSAAGLSHVSGSTWRRLTVTNTESSPGRADGLPNNSITSALARGSDVFFGTYDGAVKLSGTSWTQYDGTQHSAFTRVYSLGFGPAGQLWLGTDSGLFEVTP